MPRLEPLRADHAAAILAFEQGNRGYFAASITDRGDEFFAHFPERYQNLLTAQEAGQNLCYVLTDVEGGVLGRFNLYDLDGGVAAVGYRVAQRVAGRGLATAALRELCAEAARKGLHTLVAATAHQNLASQRVLIKGGFVPVGPADPAELGGKQGTRYLRQLGVDPAVEAHDRSGGRDTA
jgi:[ribosomal protein S5]-alanine N-acetyltransferase